MDASRCVCLPPQMLDMLRLQQNALHGDKMEIIIIALIVVRAHVFFRYMQHLDWLISGTTSMGTAHPGVPKHMPCVF